MIKKGNNMSKYNCFSKILLIIPILGFANLMLFASFSVGGTSSSVERGDTTLNRKRDTLIRISEKTLDSMRQEMAKKTNIPTLILPALRHTSGVRLDSLKLDSIDFSSQPKK